MTTASPNRNNPNQRAGMDLLVILGLATAIFFVFSKLDAFEWLVGIVHRYEHYELDEIVVLISVLFFAIAVFAVRRWVESRREYAKRLESERLKVALEAAGAVSHEFNQPLQVIMSASEMALLDTPEGSPLRRYLSDIINSAKKIAGLITKFNRINVYRTKPYVGESKILDWD